MTGEDPLALRVVHERRGGHLDADGSRYPIGHVEAGRFSIAFPAGSRCKLQAHPRRIEQLVLDEPGKWFIDKRSKSADG